MYTATEILNYLALLGRFVTNVTQTLGQAVIFLFRVVYDQSKTEKIFPLVIQQIYFLGILSLIIIVMAGLFVGMVLSLQGYYALTPFGSEQAVGKLTALSLMRELGPVVSALLFAGRAGSALTAEIGLMKTTEQLASMEMMGVDPLKQVIAPRLLAGIICVPLLNNIFVFVGIMGGTFISIDWLSIDLGSYWVNLQQDLRLYEDIFNGIIKSCIFGFVITWIALFQGYNSEPTARGISKATTKTVVYASLATLGLDFLLTALMFGD